MIFNDVDFVQYNDGLGKKILYSPCQRIENILSHETQSLIAELKEKVEGRGIGLAANQIGHHLQAFVIELVNNPEDPRFAPRYPKELPSVPFQLFINPRITASSEERVSFWHGCLSALEMKERGKVATYAWLDYEAFNAEGQKINGRLTDMAAVIFQHEFRHMLGKLYLDCTDIFMPLEVLNEKRSSGAEGFLLPCGQEVPLLLADYDVGDSIEDYARKKCKK